MRKLLTFALLIAASGILSFLPLGTGAAQAAPLPRYGSVVDATAVAFTASFRTLGKTEYVTCSMPAPIGCGTATDAQQDIWGGLSGRAYRNEAGSLQVTVNDSAAGPVLAAYVTKDGSWDKVREWAFVGGASRVLVAGDGKHFAVIAADGTVVSYGTDSVAPLSTTTLAPDGSSITLSSTGMYLAWYKAAKVDGTGERCYALAGTRSGKTVETCDPVKYWDLVTEDNRIIAFSPDDTKLVFRSDRDGAQKPYLVRLTGSIPASLTPELLVAKPYQVADFAFIDSDRLALVANRSGATSWGLWSLGLTSGVITQVAGGASYGVPLRRFGVYLGFGRTTATGVEAALYNVGSGSVTDVSSLAKTGIPTGSAIAAPATVSVTATGGGYAVWEPGTKAAGQTPIVLWLHGGPYRQVSTAGYHPFASYGSFDWLLEEVRQSGAIVAKLDYPGSYGYGRAYAESLTGSVGVKDVASVKAAIASLRTKYGASSPVYLVGNSYGGYLADKVLVEAPSLVSGIYSISGVSGWEELLAANPESIFKVQFENATAGDSGKLFQQAEILLKAKNIGSQKVLLAHGDADTSVSVSQTKTLDELLKIERKSVSTTIYAGEDHVFAKPENIADLCRKAIGLVGGNASGRCAL